MRVWVWARGATYVLLLLRALLAVVGIGDARLATDDTATLIGAVVALVADTHEDARPHVGVADGALAVALFAQAANRCKARDMGGSGEGGDGTCISQARSRVLLAHRCPAASGT